MPEVSRWYPTKIDRWMAVLLAIIPLVSLAGFVMVLMAGGGLVITIVSIAVLVLVYVGLVFPMRYGITEDAIVVRHGMVTRRIPLRDIIEVGPTRNPLGSPALSLDRLRISTGPGLLRATLISPADKAGFLAELASRAGLRRDGDRLVRASAPAPAP